MSGSHCVGHTKCLQEINVQTKFAIDFQPATFNQKWKAFMYQSGEILRSLERAAAEKSEMKLLNIYKGIPISYPTQILSISDRTVALRLHKYQAMCMHLQGHTFIQSEGLESVIRGDVAAVDILGESAVMFNLKYADREIGNRKAIRVQPKEPCPAYLFSNNQRFLGEIADISLSGIGIFLNIFYARCFSIRLPVTLKVLLAQGITLKEISGRVVYLGKANAYTNRLGIEYSLEPPEKELISDYLNQRQVELQQELQQCYYGVLQLS
jgi:hypothetical protein